jgi:MFS transporter, DHA2 family, multidrug resistance protein
VNRADAYPSAANPVPNRGMITLSIMLANIMQGLDNTILNVALPHIQGGLSASQDQVAWVLTSYIVCSAIMMPLTGWLAGRFGIKYIFLASVLSFTLASALCGIATSLGELVAFRALQGLAGAGLIPLSQAVLLRINPPERHGHAMAVFGTGTIMGPIMGPALGGWLTQDYSWRWAFYINLPVGLLCALGILVFIRPARNIHRESFDFIGFLTLSVAVGALQLMLDRGELMDWFHSSEIWAETAIAGLGFYLFTVHTATTGGPSFLNRDLLTNGNFVAGTLMMFSVGYIMSSTSALLPTMMQQLMDYPALTTGLISVPRGIGVMIAMFMVGRLINRVDARLLIVLGFALTALGAWQMSGFSLGMGMAPLITTGMLQGFGLGCTFVPLNLVALSNLPRQILTQGTAIRSLMRNVGGSIGISTMVATLAENTQTVHARLVEPLRPDNPLMHAPWSAGAWSLNGVAHLAALNREVTRQAAMVGYIDDFKAMALIALLALPFLVFLREARPTVRAAPASPAPVAAPAGADD